MRIAVVGLGAIGGLLAARLSRAGHEVSALARGETLARVRASGLQLDSMRNNMFPTPLLTYKNLGMTLAPLAGETIGGKTTVGLLLTPKSGAPVKLYFDPQTGLLLRTTTKISSPDLGELDQTSDVSDYRDVDGVKVPFVVVNTNPAQTVRVVLTRVEHNVALDDKLFGR